MSLLSRAVLLGSTVVLACGGSAPPPLGPGSPASSASPHASTTPQLAASSTAISQKFAPSPPSYAFTDPERKKKLTSAFPEIDAVVAEEMTAQRFPGGVVGVVIDGELAYAKGFGVSDLDKKTKPDADTIFRIGSISKSFVGLAALALRDEKLVDFDDPLAKYLPEAAGLVYPTNDSAPITLRHLLTHTSGLPRDNPAVPMPAPTEADMLKALAGFALETPPGLKHQYSNFGYSILGLALGRAARASFHDVVRTRVTAPLGMKSTVWTQKEVPADRMASGYLAPPKMESRPAPFIDFGADDPSGGLYSSLRDMGRYVAAQLAAYPARNDPEEAGVRRSSLREAHASGLPSFFRVTFADKPKKGESLLSGAGDAYGFGWVARQSCAYDDLVWHNGGLPGYMSDVRFLKERGVGVITLVNSFPGEPAMVSSRVMGVLARSGGLSKRTLPPPPHFEPLMKKLLAVYNEWDEATYKSLQSAKRPPLMDIEKKELADYKELHGACKEFKFAESRSPREASFTLNCERGPLEIRLVVSPVDGLLAGFVGVTRGLPVPKDLRPIADKLTALIRKWDQGTFAKHLSKQKNTREGLVQEFESMRLHHGSCAVQSMTAVSDARTVVLECEHGGELELSLELDKRDPAQVISFAFNVKDGVCPVR
jgi:CubicO group peptidase (beta-lactamase class C family)